MGCSAHRWDRPQLAAAEPSARAQGFRSKPAILLADAQLADDFAIAVGVVLLQVIEQAAALAHQHQQTAAGAVVLLVRLEVLGQLADALAQDRNLYLRAAGIR